MNIFSAASVVSTVGPERTGMSQRVHYQEVTFSFSQCMLGIKDILPMEYKTNLNLANWGLLTEIRKPVQHFKRLVN